MNKYEIEQELKGLKSIGRFAPLSDEGLRFILKYSKESINELFLEIRFTMPQLNKIVKKYSKRINWATLFAFVEIDAEFRARYEYKLIKK